MDLTPQTAYEGTDADQTQMLLRFISAFAVGIWLEVAIPCHGNRWRWPHLNTINRSSLPLFCSRIVTDVSRTRTHSHFLNSDKHIEYLFCLSIQRKHSIVWFSVVFSRLRVKTNKREAIYPAHISVNFINRNKREGKRSILFLFHFRHPQKRNEFIAIEIDRKVFCHAFATRTENSRKNDFQFFTFFFLLESTQIYDIFYFPVLTTDAILFLAIGNFHIML